jgi:hypothetical protein
MSIRVWKQRYLKGQTALRFRKIQTAKLSLTQCRNSNLSFGFPHINSSTSYAASHFTYTASTQRKNVITMPEQIRCFLVAAS